VATDVTAMLQTVLNVLMMYVQSVSVKTMRKLIRIIALPLFIATATSANVQSENNKVIGQCNLENAGDYNAAASCYFDWKDVDNNKKLIEYQSFIKANPRYLYPGQSMNRCWGKPREMPFEKSTISVNASGMTASVWYKDHLPAGCKENAPWDNRYE
jgi:hypothetical protein